MDDEEVEGEFYLRKKSVVYGLLLLHSVGLQTFLKHQWPKPCMVADARNRFLAQTLFSGCI